MHNINPSLEHETNIMNANQTLHDLGQSLWLGNTTRDSLNSGTLKKTAGIHW